MLRFLPDSLQEALLRPLVMAAPDAGIYVEIMAPDGRFLLLIFAVTWLTVSYIGGRRSTVVVPLTLVILIAFTFTAFVPWLFTSGNGRYFVPVLLLVGPVLVGVIRVLPLTRVARLTFVLASLGLQFFFIQQSSPWQTWGLLSWGAAPYFHVEVPDRLRSSPATYVTVSNISYSLIAPQFHSDSSWLNVAHSPEPIRVRSFLSRRRGPFYLLMPTLPSQTTHTGLPTAALISVISNRLRPYGLFFPEDSKCQLIVSDGVKKMSEGIHSSSVGRSKEGDHQAGFWLCFLNFDSTLHTDFPSTGSPATLHDETFRKVEESCPRFFPPGSSRTARVEGGELRVYADTEMKLYVLDDGSVFYKYYRALNPVRIGSSADILAGNVAPDCSNIPGRTGLPWQRDR